MVNKLSSKYSLSYSASSSENGSFATHSSDAGYKSHRPKMDGKARAKALEANHAKLDPIENCEFYPTVFPGQFSPNSSLWYQKNNKKDRPDSDLPSNNPTGENGRNFIPVKKKNNGCVMTIGLVGMTVGAAGLLAYCLVQIPSLREKLYKYPPYLYYQEDLKNLKIRGVFTPGEVAYGFELFGIISFTMTGILTNILLMYGVSKKAHSFLLPWLAFEAFFIIILIVSFLLAIIFATPIKMKGFSAVPIVIAIVAIFCWIKVFNFYKSLRRAKMEKIYHTLTTISNVEGFRSWYNAHSLPRRLQEWEESPSDITYKSFDSNIKEN